MRVQMLTVVHPNIFDGRTFVASILHGLASLKSRRRQAQDPAERPLYRDDVRSRMRVATCQQREILQSGELE